MIGPVETSQAFEVQYRLNTSHHFLVTLLKLRLLIFVVTLSEKWWLQMRQQNLIISLCQKLCSRRTFWYVRSDYVRAIIWGQMVKFMQHVSSCNWVNHSLVRSLYNSWTSARCNSKWLRFLYIVPICIYYLEISKIHRVSVFKLKQKFQCRLKPNLFYDFLDMLSFSCCSTHSARF